MIPVIPWYITVIVLATSVAAAIGVWRLVHTGARRAALPADERRRISAGAAIGLAVWLGLALALAPAPETLAARDPFYLTPLLPLFALGSAAVVLVALGRSRSLRLALASVPLAGLHGVQLYRVIGAVFLVLLARDQLPAHFALPAGWGDIAIGLAAPFVALGLAGRRPGARALAAGWNVLGLFDLVVAVGMGTGWLAPLLAPELGARVPPAAAMGVFPLVLVPTFAVPLSVTLHVIGLGRLLREWRSGVRLVPRPAS